MLTPVAFCVGLAFGYFVLPLLLAARALPDSNLSLMPEKDEEGTP